MRHPILKKDVPVVIPPLNYSKQLLDELVDTAHAQSVTTARQAIRHNTTGEKATAARMAFVRLWPEVITQALDNADKLFSHSFLITESNGMRGVTVNGNAKELATILADVMEQNEEIGHIVRMAVRIKDNQ